MPDVVVVGAGLIGLGVAWRAAQRGLSVTVVDPNPGSGASHAAAGMLAPVTELHYGEERLLALGLESLRRYPAFVAELEQLTGASVGYRETGTLAVAFDGDDKAVLTDLRGYQHRLGLAAQWLTARECRRLEPMLAPGIRGGLLVTGDHQVDNRLLVAALLIAAERAGAILVREQVRDIVVEHDRATGVRTATDTIGAEQIVLAAGCWSARIAGLPADVVPPVRPVKGQIVRLRGPKVLDRNLRAVAKGFPVYVVPRADGELVIGATVEERGFDTRVLAGGVYELLRDVHLLLPAVAELELTECYAGLRPGSPDNAPLLGPSALPGLVLATGHYRNGVLLTPVTAELIADALVTGVLTPVIHGELGTSTGTHRGVDHR